MSYRIDPAETVEDALRRIAHEQVAKAIAWIDGDRLDVHATVHKVRVRRNEVRALARLVRECFDAYPETNRALRDLGRVLADLRDGQAFLDQRRRARCRRTHPLGARLFDEDPDAFCRRREALWSAA